MGSSIKSNIAKENMICTTPGVNYIGICCGAGPHHVRAMAEALGRKTAAGKYPPDMTLYPIFGDTDTKVQHVECLLGPVDD